MKKPDGLKWIGPMGLGVVMLLSVSCLLLADPVPHSEYEIKAAFLYNFAKFVEWPTDALQKNPGNLVIGIIGNDPFGKNLDEELNGKTIQDKKIILKRISHAEEASHCHVLFISASKEGEVDSILSVIQGLPILTVSDMDDFVQRGGIVGFSLERKKVRFSINAKGADKTGLKVSSQLLKLAKRVISRRFEKKPYVCLPFAHTPSARS